MRIPATPFSRPSLEVARAAYRLNVGYISIVSVIPVFGCRSAVNALQSFDRNKITILDRLFKNFGKLVSEVNNFFCAGPASPSNLVSVVRVATINAVAFFLEWQRDAHSNHRLFYLTISRMNARQNTKHPILNGLWERFRPHVYGLNAGVTHGLSRLFWRATKQFNSFLFVHAPHCKTVYKRIVNLFPQAY